MTAATLSVSDSDCSDRSSSMAPVTLLAKAVSSVAFADAGAGAESVNPEEMASMPGERGHQLRPICRADFVGGCVRGPRWPRWPGSRAGEDELAHLVTQIDIGVAHVAIRVREGMVGLVHEASCALPCAVPAT